MQTFWEIMLLLTMKRQRFCAHFLLLENCAKYCLDPEPEREPELNFSKVGIGTRIAVNHYGSKALTKKVIFSTILPVAYRGWLPIFSTFAGMIFFRS
jgi:hypothetical protein